MHFNRRYPWDKLQVLHIINESHSSPVCGSKFVLHSWDQDLCCGLVVGVIRMLGNGRIVRSGSRTSKAFRRRVHHPTNNWHLLAPEAADIFRRHEDKFPSVFDDAWSCAHCDINVRRRSKHLGALNHVKSTYVSFLVKVHPLKSKDIGIKSLRPWKALISSTTISQTVSA